MRKYWGIAAAVAVFYVTFGLFCVNIVGDAGDNEHNSIYLEEAEGKDVVLIWNSGGWGRKSLEDDPEWVGIFDGIESELRDMGYSSVTVNYIRSEDNLRGLLREIMGSLLRYPSRAKELADEVDLLTRSNSDCKVILLAISNGAIFVNEVMKHLEDNPRVYSIQASRLFWYRASTAQRSLLINDNGETPDVLSSGNIWSIIRENAWRLPTTEKPPGGSGMIGDRFIKVPGHEYMWDLPGVRAEITSFLHTNFGSQ
jgi:hypothetical protein